MTEARRMMGAPQTESFSYHYGEHEWDKSCGMMPTCARIEPEAAARNGRGGTRAETPTEAAASASDLDEELEFPFWQHVRLSCNCHEQWPDESGTEHLSRIVKAYGEQQRQLGREEALAPLTRLANNRDPQNETGRR